MSMAEDDYIRIVASEEFFRRGRPDLMAVTYVNGKSLDVHVDPRSQCGLAEVIGIAEDGMNRSNRAELDQDAAAADVTRMKNQIDALESPKDLGSYEAVRVRNQPDLRPPTSSFLHPANLYPIPWTVRMNCGWRGLGSIFCRSQATWTSTVRVDGIEL